MEIEKLVSKYLDTFGSLPHLPKLVNYSLIADLMEDAIVSKVPVSQEDIDERVKDIDEPIDLG